MLYVILSYTRRITALCWGSSLKKSSNAAKSGPFYKTHSGKVNSMMPLKGFQ